MSVLRCYLGNSRIRINETILYNDCPVFTPEQFGAIGDGVTDDYEAFISLANAVNTQGYGVVELTAGKNYKLDRYVGDGFSSTVTRIEFKRLSYLRIKGNGAKITTKGDFLMHKSDNSFGGYYRSLEQTISLSILRSNHVSITNLEIDGQGELMTFENGINGEQNANSGLCINGCSDVFMYNVYCHSYSCDAFMLGESESNETGVWLKYSGKNISINNCRFEYGSRNSMSLGVIQNAEFNDCVFGYAGNNGNGLGYSPGLSIDIEPDFGAESGYDFDTNNIRFNRCTLKGSKGGCLAIPMTYVSDIIFDNCDFIDTSDIKTYSISVSGNNIHIKNSRIKMYNTTYFDRLSTMGTIYFENNDIEVINTSLITCTSDSINPVYMTNNNITLKCEFGSPNPMPIYCSSNILIFKYNNVFCSDTLLETKLLLRGCRECIGNIYTTDRTNGSKFGVYYKWARLVENETYCDYVICAELPNS